MQADSALSTSSNVVRFPTKRKARYPNPVLRGPVPENVTLLLRPLVSAERLKAPEPLERTAEMAVLVAVLSTLPEEQRKAVKSVLQRMSLQSPDDDALFQAHIQIGGKL